MKRFGILVAVALLASLGTACSSDDKKSSGAGQAACNAYCAKIESACGDAGMDASMKVTFCELGCALLTGATGTCDASGKAYYDCLSNQSNVCADGCKTEEAQYTKDCKIEAVDAG